MKSKKNVLHYNIPVVKDIPLMKEEQCIVERLTAKQVEISMHPGKRNNWSLTTPEGMTIYYQKNCPRMSDIVAFTLCVHHAMMFIQPGSADFERKNALERMDLWLDMVKDEASRTCASVFYNYSMMYIFEELEDYDYAERHRRSFLVCKANCPKSFGWTIGKNEIEEYMEFLRIHQLQPDILDYLTNISQFRIDTYNSIIKDEEGYEAADLKRYADTVYYYVEKLSEELPEEVTELSSAFLIAYGVGELTTNYRAKKGSFDYNYAKAEKGDKAMQLAVAKAYREGIEVPINLRLAELWESVATGNYVLP